MAFSVPLPLLPLLRLGHVPLWVCAEGWHPGIELESPLAEAGAAASLEGSHVFASLNIWNYLLLLLFLSSDLGAKEPQAPSSQHPPWWPWACTQH